MSAFPHRLAALFVVTFPLITAAAEPQPGRSYFRAQRHVEYVAGNLPVVLVAPHGGRLRPEAIPDRKEGVLDGDANTQELARAMAEEFLARTGRNAHLVLSLLHRRKLDPNREIKEAAQGSAAAEAVWREFHAAIEGALAAAVAQHGFAFLIDLHGHAHPIPRLELGYGLGAAQLNQSDAAFDRSNFAGLSTVRDLHARVGGSGAALLRGPGSLGDLFARRGYRAVPSPQEPAPGANPFFSGGYIVRRHAGEPATTKVDGVQFEIHRTGVRDTAENRAAFARASVDVLTTFLRERYRFEAVERAGQPAPAR
jgi:N-formylglutamate amidohydrolase